MKISQRMTYLVVGKEGKGEDETFHLQGYLAMKNRTLLTTVKKILPKAHWEIKSMKSTHSQASEYCKKEGDYVEYGTLPLSVGEVASLKMQQNWDSAFALAKAGKLDEIPKDMLIKYYHSFKRIAQDHPIKHPPLDHTCGIWITGPTGVGKSRKARHDHPDFYDKCLNKWWDGYRNEPSVILDDIDKSHGQWIGPFLKRWTDHYAFPAEQKGTTVQIRPKEIVVTSQYSIAEIFESQDQQMVEALERRFKTITMEACHMPFMPDQTDLLADGPEKDLPDQLPDLPDLVPMDESSSDCEKEPRLLTATEEFTLSDDTPEEDTPEIVTIDKEIEQRELRISKLIKKLT